MPGVDTGGVTDEAVKVVEGMLDAWNSGDLDAVLPYFDPACEVVFRPQVPEPGPFHGRDKLREWADGFLSAWESVSTELASSAGTGDRLFAEVRLKARGTGSGIDTEFTEVFVFTVRGGRIVRWQGFTDPAEARAAAGLSG
jgi:ketosteroid isomerase-like protein